jgi:two-component system sensor histidine kinase ChiS
MQALSQSDIFSDAVNLAYRLEGLNKLYGAAIIISAETLSRLHDASQYHTRFLGKVQVKSKSEIVPIYEIFSGDPELVIALKLETKADFEQGLRHYFAREFSAAAACFKNVLQRHLEDKTAQLYLQRATRYAVQGVGEEWEGVEAMESV